MVNRIDRLYEQSRALPVRQDETPKPSEELKSTEVREDGRIRRENVAERIAPHLHDQVEISEQAREAIRAEEAQGQPDRSPVDRETLQQLQDSWYVTGYQQALEQMDAVRES